MRCTAYIGSKNYCWIWIAVDRYERNFINSVLGSRSADTGKKLWDKIKVVKVGRVMTDHWKAYKKFVPSAQHVKSKAETFTVEGYNSLFRHFLARLCRKSKCYSKSSVIFQCSVNLFIAKRNNTISIFD